MVSAFLNRFGKIKGTALADWAHEYQENAKKFQNEIKEEYKWKKHEYPAFFAALQKLFGKIEYYY